MVEYILENGVIVTEEEVIFFIRGGLTGHKVWDSISLGDRPMANDMLVIDDNSGIYNF